MAREDFFSLAFPSPGVFYWRLSISELFGVPESPKEEKKKPFLILLKKEIQEITHIYDIIFDLKTSPLQQGFLKDAASLYIAFEKCKTDEKCERRIIICL